MIALGGSAIGADETATPAEPGRQREDPGDLITSSQARKITGLEATSSFVRIARRLGLKSWRRSWSSRRLWSASQVREVFHVEQDNQANQAD